MQNTLSKDTKQKIQSKLFQAIFQLPPAYKQEVKKLQESSDDQKQIDTKGELGSPLSQKQGHQQKDKENKPKQQKEKEKKEKEKDKDVRRFKNWQQYCQQLHTKVQVVIKALINQAKTNSQQIQKVCKTNSKLYPAARLLRQHAPPEGVKQNNFSLLISSIIDMFTLMMTSSKMIQFFNKLNIPFSLYRILLRMYCNCGKFEFYKKAQVYESFKFIWKFLNIKNKSFPRLYGSLILNILNEYTQKMIQKQKKQGQDLIVSKQNERMQQCIKTVINIALDLIRTNLNLAAESGVLVAMYRKAIENDLSTSAMTILVQTIAYHMNTSQNRLTILKYIDLCRVFALFTYVDYRPKQGKTQQRIERCAIMVELLLSHCSTLFYLISEKVTLKNFVLSLKSKSKSQKQLAIINDKIFKKLIDKALRYDRNKMQRSNNSFGLFSNYLNYRALLILSFFLDSTELFETYLNSDPNGYLFAGLGKISLMYFPITFQKGKYNKQIIQTIKLPSASDYEKLSRDFLNILSYYDYCIIPYEFAKNQLISYLLEIKGLDCYADQFPQQNKDQIQNLLNRAKKSHCQDFDELLLNFYTQIMKVCQILPWKPEHLKLAKFLSVIVDYLRNRNYNSIMSACLQILNKIFESPKQYYFRYLFITVLDDIGKYFQDHNKVQQLILTHYRNYDYAFRISRILLHTDFNKREAFGANNHRKLLETICCQGGCQQLILQAIQIIKFYIIDNDDKADWGAQIICEKLIYHHSQDIAAAAVQFCEQFIINHRSHKNYLYKINLAGIKDNNQRKRIMYLLLNCDKGIQLLNAYNPSFIKDQIDLWLKEGPNFVKQLSNFLAKQNKRFVVNKDGPFLDIGKVSENRHKLIFLPWNVGINGKQYIALAAYKTLKEKIKLRVSPQLLVETKIELSYVDIGGFPVGSNEIKNTICVKREEIIKNYERSKQRENRQVKKISYSRDKAVFYFKYEAGCLVLERVLIDISLSRDVYRSISYPLSFLTLMTKTGKGFNLLRQYKFLQGCLQACRYREEKDEKDLDIELSKGSIQCLCILFACWKLQVLQKIQIFTAVFQLFDKTSNFQLKQVALWALNIIVKDDDMRKKLKQFKGWLILQSKYCGWLCYPQFYNQIDFSQIQICQFSHISAILPERNTNYEGFRLIQSVLQLADKTEKDILTQKAKKKQMIQFFKKTENKEQAWNPKLLEQVITYVSVVNFGIQRTREVLDMFTDYYLSQKFDIDLPYGWTLK